MHIGTNGLHKSVMVIPNCIITKPENEKELNRKTLKEQVKLKI